MTYQFREFLRFCLAESLSVPYVYIMVEERFIYDFTYIKTMRVNTTLQREVDQTDKQPVTEKSLTLKDISPKWFERLFSKKMNLPFPLSPMWFKWYFELDSPAKCVIGEAHGYTSSYELTCKECNRLGWSFGKSFILRSRPRLENDLRDFVYHWNKTHLR